jgi:hypothetical protein
MKHFVILLQSLQIIIRKDTLRNDRSQMEDMK